jgi:hypothetical protein
MGRSLKTQMTHFEVLQAIESVVPRILSCLLSHHAVTMGLNDHVHDMGRLQFMLSYSTLSNIILCI